ncbi:uncharacterized protein TRIADDRAFT_58340 [Trichoplax adhaerens]|uniref:Solute carrier organic anion transporter family member n=1 Tax=Trichoplax adhaerens TaxID=10228 RepID=B3S1M3_TRIAD|nr:hypothetical protein TRIADDRAFT_58340 [Trichoplax adhaerens]EDV23254.1 hypothetical protein TRIADDRAFT_58340 [Trichoplax adhaerens]|eukprot:XP_002114164.1 hypothetical protein TRIADDRAFT_58340 [Trichoplax adhaerens]
MDSKENQGNTEKNDNISDVKSQDNLVKSRYGCLWFQPNWLQFFNSPIWLTFIIGLYQFLYQAVSGFKGSTISTLEKGFNLSATDISVITIFFNVPNAICGLIFSFLAIHGHKGKWMTASLLIVGIGLLTYAMPHWIIGSYQILNHLVFGNNDGNCHPTGTSNSTLNSTSILSCNSYTKASNGLYYFAFALSQFITGVGVCTLRTIGWSYIDDSVSPTSSPLYMGFVLSMLGLGPAIGFVLGGLAANTFVYWPRQPPAGLNPDSPQWLGAWWLGYVASGSLLLTLIIPMIAFPRRLPNYEIYKAEREKLAVGKSKVDREYGRSFKEFLPATKEILTNIPFMATVASVVIKSIMLSGLATFLPKYIESQFGLRAADSSIYVGIIIIFGLFGGMAVGGGVMKAKKMGAVSIAKFTFIISVLGTISAALFFMFKCDNAKIAGIHRSHTNTSSRIISSSNLISACNRDCQCGINTFYPICDLESKITYFSPCLAGCQSSQRSDTYKEVYYNCSCIQGSRQSNRTFDAIKNYCPRNCIIFIPFLVVVGILVFLTYINLMLDTQLLLRCVPDSQKSFALSIEWVFIQLIGTTLGPLLIGYSIDASCILWNEQCGEKKFCWLYNNANMTNWISGLASLLRGIATIFSFIAWYNLRKDVMKEKIPMDVSNGNVPLKNLIDSETTKSHKPSASII